jgi:SMODS and SLOG-associating 2TM effector domain 1/Protein of unknown function (DUF4231)
MGEMSGEPVALAWAQQRVWSQTADRLKQRIDLARSVALGLAIAAATLAVAAVQVADFSSWAGRTLAVAAAISAGLAPMSQRRAGTDQIQAWTRARSASEGLKTEVFAYLAGGSAYTGDDRERHLGERTRGIVADVADLQRHSLDITPDDKPVPVVTGIDSYITERVNDQITRYYRPTAAKYVQRVRRLRAAGNLLALIAVVLAALAASFDVAGLTGWVPVVTTVGTSVVAYIAAARYDHMIIVFLRTAQRLEHLRSSRADTPTGNAAFIDACENAISIENQGWMARWVTEEGN